MIEEATGTRATSIPREESALPAVRLAPYPVAIGLLFASLLLGAAIGPVGISPVEVVQVLAQHILSINADVTTTVDTIVWEIRLPRVLLAALVGGTLAYSGAAYQGIFRNPLADPYLIGVASGAGLAATIVIVSPLPLTVGPVSLITLAAFGGALIAATLSYSLARVNGTTPTTTLILAGVAISAIAVSATSYLMLVNQAATLSILSWLLGGFNDSGWHKMWFIVPYVVPAGIVIYLHARLLNVMQLDEQQAQQLGVHVERTKLIVLLAASLAAAAAVSVAGIVGLVGLIAPHTVRLFVGPDYRRLLPLSALLGASFLVLADLGARTVVSPGELPVGVITAMIGAPFFLFLLRRQTNAFF